MKKPGEDPEEPGEIETKTVDEVKQEPYNMPPGFEWCHVDVMDAAEAEVKSANLGLCFLTPSCAIRVRNILSCRGSPSLLLKFGRALLHLECLAFVPPLKIVDFSKM